MPTSGCRTKPPRRRAPRRGRREIEADPMTTVDYIPASVEPNENYLNISHRVKSWLLTVDHKRIAILYLISMTFFFAIGGAFATLVRIELATPKGDLVTAETYNKFFTMHGVFM